MGANEVLAGRYSMVTNGFTIDDALIIPGATMRGGPNRDYYPATLKVLEPVTALGVVSYDGGSDNLSGGGTMQGFAVLRSTTAPSFVTFADPITKAGRSEVQYHGTSGLGGKLGDAQEPLFERRLRILPISRYWIDDPDRLTGRAVMFVQHGTDDLQDSDISVLHYFFVLEDRKSNPDRVLKISFLATDTRFFSAPFAEGAGKRTIDPPTPFIEWGTQTRVSDGFQAATSLTELCKGDLGLRDRILLFAKDLGLYLAVS